MKEVFDNLKLNDHVYQITNSGYDYNIRRLKISDIDKKGRNIEFRLERGNHFSTTSNKTHCKNFYTTEKEAKEVLFNSVRKEIERLEKIIFQSNLELERYKKSLENIKKMFK